MAQLLVGMASGQLINQHVSRGGAGAARAEASHQLAGADLPFWVKVAHKWGDLPQARNDAGIVFTPRGSYVVAVLTADGEPDEAASVIARAARTVVLTGRG